MTNKETIYRQDVLDLAKKGVLISNGSYKSVCKAINELPPANPQPCQEKWIDEDDNRYICKECEYAHKPQKEPCDDAISRAEAIKIASGYCHPANVAKELAKLPAVTPQPKTGHWIEHPEIETSAPEYLMFYECSECGDRQCFCKSDIHKKRFCSNCGCRMVEPQERSGEA